MRKESLKEWIVRFLYPYGSVRRVYRGLLLGYRYVVEPGMGGSFAWNSGSPERAFLTERVPSGATVYDVGANRGQFALLFSHLVGEAGHVVSFEPVEKLADLVRRNAELNEIGNIRVVAAAASEESGTATFSYTDEHSTQGMLQSTEPSYQLEDAEMIEVRTVSLDGVVDEMEAGAPDIMKVDVEGGGRSRLFGGFISAGDACP
jgi:FkbM family methyltransferase